MYISLQKKPSTWLDIIWDRQDFCGPLSYRFEEIGTVDEIDPDIIVAFSVGDQQGADNFSIAVKMRYFPEIVVRKFNLYIGLKLYPMVLPLVQGFTLKVYEEDIPEHEESGIVYTGESEAEEDGGEGEDLLLLEDVLKPDEYDSVGAKYAALLLERFAEENAKAEEEKVEIVENVISASVVSDIAII